MLNVAYYITGHGFGHVTRSLELIRGMLQTKRFHMHIVTNIPRSFFKVELQEFDIDIDTYGLDEGEGKLLFHHWQRNLDTGGIQKDVIHMDPLATLDAYYREIHLNREKLIAQEVEWAVQEQIEVMLMDASTLPCAVANRIHDRRIKTIFVTNFSWDFIYESVLSELPEHSVSTEQRKEYETMVKTCREDMLTCTYYIRYPGECPVPAELDAAKTCLGPLITRSIRNHNLRQELNIPEGMKLLLLGFGGHATEWNLRDENLPEGWICLVLRANESLMPSKRFRSLPHEVYVPDLIHAVDVTLGKVGYGFVSESISGGTPLIYVPRVHWHEEDYLVHLLCTKFDAGVRMSLEEFNRGNWKPYMEEALEKRGKWTMEADFHPQQATERIISIIDHVIKDLRKLKHISGIH